MTRKMDRARFDGTMFKKARKHVTLGDLRRSGQRVGFFCVSCNTVTYKSADEVSLPDNFDVQYLAAVLPCPECGHTNGDFEGELRIAPESH